MDHIFSERLDILRGRKTIKEFADICGVHQNTMGNYLKGNSEPDVSTLRKLASNNGVSIAFLVGEEPVRPGRSVTGDNNIIAGERVVQVTGNSNVYEESKGLPAPTSREEALFNRIRRLTGSSPVLLGKIEARLDEIEAKLNEI